MYFALDNDMEITADRYVISRLGREKRAFYANILISAVKSRKKQVVFYYYFKNNIIKERVEAIMKFKKLTVGALVVTLLVPSCMFTVFATTDTIITGQKLDNLDITIVNAEYGEPAEQMEDISIEIPWEELKPYTSQDTQRAASSQKISNYKYITYGKTPPTNLEISTKIDGKTYIGTLKRTRYTYDDSTDKYTGYYSGTVYVQ